MQLLLLYLIFSKSKQRLVLIIIQIELKNFMTFLVYAYDNDASIFAYLGGQRKIGYKVNDHFEIHDANQVVNSVSSSIYIDLQLLFLFVEESG